jgi:O-antigen ligase
MSLGEDGSAAAPGGRISPTGIGWRADNVSVPTLFSWLPRTLVRAGALAGLLAVLAYPVAGFWGHPQLTTWLKGLWVVLALGAALAPRQSLLLFLFASPLLLTAPSLLRWPAVSLPELWLAALLVSALARQIVRPHASRLPSAALVLGVLASVSLLATLYPLQYGQGGVGALLLSLRDFTRDDLLTLSSQRHIFSSLLAWVIVCEGLALLWLMLDTFESANEQAAQQLALALGGGAAVVATWGLYQRWTGQNLLEFWRIADPYVVRINATFTDVNVLGSYLASMVPLSLALATVDLDRDRRKLWWAVVAIVILATLFTGSRAAWLAALAGGVWWLLRAHPPSRRVVTRLGVAALGILVLATLVGTLRDVRPVGARSYLDMALYTVNLRVTMDDRFKGRPELWRAAAKMVVDRPLTGVGIGRYYKEVSAYATKPDELIRPQENAHNYFLQVAAELGLPGIAVFLALVALPFVVWRSLQLRPGASPPSPWLPAAVAGIAAHVLTWLTGHPLLIRDGQMTFWPLVALALLVAPADMCRRWQWRWPPAAVAASLGIVMLTGRVAADVNVARVDLSRAPLGVYDTEVDPRGQSFRWTKERASLYVPSSSRTFTLTMRSLAPFPQTVSVMLDGARVDELTFGGHEWRTSRYQLPRNARSARFHRFDLVVAPTWRPPNDDRVLGILLGDVSWTP